MLRVLAVTNVYPTVQAPGVGTFIEQQVKGLEASGVEVDLLFIDRPRQGMSAYLHVGGQVRRRLAMFRPHVVHAMYGGIMADEVGRAVRDTPLVVSFCGEDLLGEPLSAYLEAGKPVAGCLRKIIAGYGVWASYRAARRAHRIVVKSKNLQEALPRDVDPTKVHIIPNGVDLERFRPMDQREARRRLGWPAETLVVLFVTAAGVPRKRLGLAEAAVASIPTGDRPVEFRIMSGVPHAQVPLWLNAADVLLLTSFHEGGVNIVKEAMACNLPIVSVDVGDVRERLDGVRACAVAEATPTALGETLRCTLQQRERSDGRNHLQVLTLTAVAERLKEVYTQALYAVAAPLGYTPATSRPTASR
ncbi:MAG: glycosyltransferase [Candidatus Binatia bacterium]